MCYIWINFVDRGLLLTRKQLKQGFLKERLKSSLQKFVGSHHDLVERFNIQVTNDNGYNSHCRDNQSVPVQVVTIIDCDFCEQDSCYSSLSFQYGVVGAMFVFRFFCWPRYFLSSDLTISVCPFVIFEVYLHINELGKKKTLITYNSSQSNY